MERKDRFTRAFEYLRMEGLVKNQKSLAESLGATAPHISSALKGNEKYLTDNLLMRLCAKYPMLNLAWLIDEKGEMIAKELPNPEVESKYSVFNADRVAESLQVPREPYNIKTKPHLPVNAVAGLIGEYYNGIREPECEHSNVISQFPQYDFTMTIHGDSMEPNLHHGDIIACHRIFKTIQWGRIYLIDTKDGAFVKKIEEEDESIRCISLNKDYKDFLIEKNDIDGYYEVVGILRTRI